MNIHKEDSPLAFVAIQAALKAGNLLKRNFGMHLTVASKSSSNDLVTNLDKESEKTIIDYIRQEFPTHSFLAEESGHLIGNSRVCWIIDPLDGTMNFVHHIPLFAVSIAALIDDQIEVAVIYDPMTNELFVAQRGNGAFLNGTRLHVSATTQIKKAIVATGFPYSICTLNKETVTLFTKFVDLGVPIRLLGSAVLSLAYVAAGRLDAYYGNNLNIWDIAAGKLLVEEAGGKISEVLHTSLDTIQKSPIAATNGHLHHQITSFL